MDDLDPTGIEIIEAARLRSEAFDLIPIKVAAQMLGVSVRTVRRWQASGRMSERVLHGHRLKYRRGDIEKMSEQSRYQRGSANV